MTVARKNHLVARLGAADEFGQLGFGFRDGDFHGGDLDHLLVQIKETDAPPRGISPTGTAEQRHPGFPLHFARATCYPPHSRFVSRTSANHVIDPKQIAVSPILSSAFAVAKIKYHDHHVAWTKLSALLAGRFALAIAAISLQRQGDLDLLLRCLEDEFESGKATNSTGVDFTFHYQIMLSESWIVGCYEILRAFRQRDSERKLAADAVSVLPSFKALFADLELLRMPMAKYEIAKDRRMKHPLGFVARPENDETINETVYDKNDPSRAHRMPTGVSERGSVTWLALDHSGPREYWIERRDLADRLLALQNEIVPAGILEAQRAAARNDSN